jgi:TRAP-type mannitol/chloroaromatic compound transport system substrate-binding protein
VWESFDQADRRLIETAAAGEYALSLAEFNTNNARALRDLRTAGVVQIREFDRAMLKTFAEISHDVVAEAGSGDDLSRDIYRSYSEFRASIGEWSAVAERAYLDVRAS